MADDAPSSQGAFDVATVKALVALMSRFDLNEIDLREGTARIRLLRGAGQMPLAAMPAAPIPAAAAVSPVVAKVPVADKPAISGKKLIDIKSPTLGTFYAKPSPDTPNFVNIGAKVVPTTVVCLIEAMKLFNEITADCAGTIAEICVEDGKPVEFNTVLFRVDPA